MEKVVTDENPNQVTGKKVPEENNVTAGNQTELFKNDKSTNDKGSSEDSHNTQEDTLKNNLHFQSSKCEVSVIANCQNSASQEMEKTGKNKSLKRKLTEDGATIERVLSEGEASSGFETISSIDSKLDIDELSLSSLECKSNYNVIVQIKNDLAYKNSKDSDRRRNHRQRSRSPNTCRNRPEKLFDKRRSQRQENSGKYSRRENNDRCCKYDRTKRWTKKNEDFHNSRNRDSSERCWSKCSDQSKRSRRSRSSDRSRRSRERWRSSDSRRYRRSRSSERDFRSRRRSRSPDYNSRRRESRRSDSSDRSMSDLGRYAPSRRQTYITKSSSVWKRLDNRTIQNRSKKDRRSPTARHLYTNKLRKERTPFLVELERKLKEVKDVKNVQKVAESPKRDNTKIPTVAKEQAVEKEQVTVVEQKPSGNPAPESNPNAVLSSKEMDPSQNVAEMYLMQYQQYAQYPQLPTLSVDNLLLVPGPTGLPVHVTVTGEQIPHDMDGRRIPIGPNGFYLPLDPTGRLFAHIVSPENQAVPIHQTEDGVLRLPNSDPVPYGPPHQLPVNIDGSFIVIGPDSKPLYPVMNLPKQPPFMQNEPQETATIFPTPETVDPNTATEVPPPPPPPPPPDPQPPALDSCLLNLIENPCPKANKKDLLTKYKKRVAKRKADVLKCKEIEKNLGVNPSKGGVKRSVPMKLTQKKSAKDNDNYSDCDMVLDSGDSDSSNSVKVVHETPKDPPEVTDKAVVTSDKTESAPEIASGHKGPKTAPADSKSEDFIVRKVQQALKSLTERNFKSPELGRFIFSAIILDPVVEVSPYESPLLKNRIKLPFITPNAQNPTPMDESTFAEKTEIAFKFLTDSKPSEKGQKTNKYGRAINRNFISTKFPVFTFDFAMQCDFTSLIIKNLNCKIAELEMEVGRLRNVNANLLDGFRNVQDAKEKQNEELGQALLEIDKKNNEILSLKRLIDESKSQ